MMIQDEWHNCYDDGWKGLITDEAFAHPAKYARGLIFRIIEHALAEGMIKPGQTVLDPFGGVALGALPALMNGLNWIGCELEPRFVEFGRKNIALWHSKFSGMPKWTGQAVLLQGDSRRLGEVVSAAGLVVGSPPYARSLEVANGIDPAKIASRFGSNTQALQNTKYGHENGQLGAMKEGDISAIVGSPPFAGNTGGRGEASRNGIDAALFDRHSGGMKRGTGDDPANLDHLPQGNIKAVVGSPPFAGSVGSDDPQKRGGLLVSDPRRAGDVNLTGSYGDTVGQLGAMVVGSPPYENTHIADITTKRIGDSDLPVWKQTDGDNYGKANGQLGQDTGETFWSAARTILDQCYQILPDNAAAIWVVKNYVKSGKIVPFAAQWQALCEACGFETIHIHRAMLVKHNGAQVGIVNGYDTSANVTNLIGEAIAKVGEVLTDELKDVARKSFFRRLAEAKGSPPIDFETVLCTRKRVA